MIRSETDIRVRYAETDAMGFVHHANYLIWFELARIEMLDALDMPYQKMEEQGYLLPVLKAELNYKQAAYFDDRLKVFCYVKEKPKVRIVIEYEVFRGATMLCSGSTEHAFINREGQPVRPVKSVMESFAQAIDSN
ncbi:MAG: acyl-CoA thioester hydrolase [Opitutaceae bacterium]|nr:acyl-CoA thioester hydrolase [Opitutaceae bacterium]|tara:strand:- start:3919 stop:4326 length:408 start_codon:yes stop_codon:yes gene_type:complete